jgi:ABC-type multidrug transport system fused ATPase/permease subunit
MRLAATSKMSTLGLLETFKSVLNLLNRRDRFKYLLVMLTQAVLGLLDLLGIGLASVIASLAVSGVQSREPNGKILDFLTMISLNSKTIQIQILTLALVTVFVLVVKTVLSVFLTRKILHFLGRRSAILSKDLISRVLAQPLVKINSHHSQEIQYAVGTGVTATMLGILGAASTLISDASLLLIISLGVLFADPIMAISMFTLFASIAIIMNLIMHSRAQVIGYEISKQITESNKLINEALSSYRELFVSNRIHFYTEKIGLLKTNSAKNVAEQTFYPNISKYVIEIVVTVGTLFIAIWQFYLNDAASAAASLGIFLAAGSRMAPALLRFQQSLLQIQGNIGASKPTLELIEELNTGEVGSNKVSQEHNSTGDPFLPSVTIRNVTYFYPNTTTPAVMDACLEIENGSFVAIVGPSGSGKSTLMDLILGVHIPTDGQVLISGLNPHDAIKRWDGKIAYVPQSIGIADDTILRNIALGLPSNLIDSLQAERAIKYAQIESLVSGVENGLNQVLGENASSISVGQRQRLGIARALYTNPKLLLLDEATSSLDPETESLISEFLYSLRGKTTLVVIAHRLSTVKNADLVVYMEAGKITARGTFSELQQQSPSFANQAKLLGM